MCWIRRLSGWLGWDVSPRDPAIRDSAARSLLRVQRTAVRGSSRAHRSRTQMAWTTEQVEALRWYAAQTASRAFTSGANVYGDGKYLTEGEVPTRCRWCRAELWMHRLGA